MKKLVMVTDLSVGGAAITCRRLVGLLGDLPGWHVDWVVGRRGTGAGVISADEWPKIMPWLLLRTVYRLPFSERVRWRMQRHVGECSVAGCVRRLKPDIILMHNIHEAATYSLLNLLPKDVPLVWRVADMWPLSGYCCYSFECQKYTSGCRGECPQWGKWGPAWRPPDVEWQLRQEFFIRNQGRIAFVAPSRWMGECVQTRFPGFRVATITNPVSLETFKPIRPKVSVRQSLGLPTDIPIILAGADCVDNPVKGMGYLLKALEHLQAKGAAGFQVVAFGTRLTDDCFPPNWKCVGPIRDENLLNLYYNAADVYVSPTLAETFGLTLAEAVAAGTPAVVFRVGGCVDTVVDGETGFVAEYRDGESLANCIGRVLGMNEDERAAMSRRCREFSEQRYLTAPTVAQRYASLLADMMRAHALDLGQGG